MPSPFPGMNPYLENASVWRDFHETLIPTLRAALVPQVMPRYVVKIEEHLYVRETEETSRALLGYADVGVAEREPVFGTNGATAVAEAPVQVRLLPALVTDRESYLEITDRELRRVITVIELLSPTNKRPGPDRDQYLAKRMRLLASAVNLVEIDLLRGWPRMPAQDLPDCAYCVVVSRNLSRPMAGCWPLGLPDRLPVIPIPLREGDRPAQVDLQQLLHQVYDSAQYGAYVYENEPEPPLAPADAEWARQILKSLK